MGCGEAGRSGEACSISSLLSKRTTEVYFCRVPHKQLKLLRQVPGFNIPNAGFVGKGAVQSSWRAAIASVPSQSLPQLT